MKTVIAHKSEKELRQFALTITTVLVVLGGVLLWRGKATSVLVLSVSLFFLLSGIFSPRLLIPVEKTWMKFGEVMGAIMTRVILVISFYLVITPMGLLLRIFGKDLLQMKWDGNARSYWIPSEPDGPGSRPDKPY